MRSAFESYHPVLCFVMLAVAIVLSMIVRHPVFQVASVVCAATCYLTTRGARALRAFAWVVPLFLIVTFVNPLFNTIGDTVLFSYFGRNYTLEAVALGASTAAMVVAMFLWFGSFNAVLTSEKITFLFRKIAPSAALVLTMILRLIPSYQRKTAQFAQARACIGKSAANGTWMDKVRNGTSLLSMLTAWALEGSVIMADSMRSRGYGLPNRSFYSRYRITPRDLVLAGAIVVLLAGSFGALAVGAAYVEYLPAMVIPPIEGWAIPGVLCYVAFLALPTIVNVLELIQWRISLSRI